MQSLTINTATTKTVVSNRSHALNIALWVLQVLLAAAGLMIVMGSATALHISRGESESAVSAAVLFVLVTIVAYTRWKVQPLAARKRA